MPSCPICLAESHGDFAYHPGCVESLFGTSAFPSLDVQLSNLYILAAKMAGKMSISGAQEKVSLTLSEDKAELRVASTGGKYILKPEPARFSAVPQNEHLTMRLASLSGIEVPPFGLVKLKDNSLAYMIKRFDRLDDGSKLHVEDFCQLSESPLRDKYRGTAELCVRILRKYATEPLLEVRKLFQMFLFSWWAANGDQHLKNFSLLATPENRQILAPAYDLVCTRLVIPDEEEGLALSICGRKSNLNLKTWLSFAEYCRMPEPAARRLISSQIAVTEEAVDMIGRSFLSEEQKSHYKAMVRENSEILRGSNTKGRGHIIVAD